MQSFHVGQLFNNYIIKISIKKKNTTSESSPTPPWTKLKKYINYR